MRKLFFFFVFLFVCSQSYAQMSDYQDLIKKHKGSNNIDTVAWIHSGSFSLGINQGVLHNWSAGGELISLTVNSLFNGTLIHFNHRKVWTTHLNANYGLLYAYSNAFQPRKTNDQIDLNSKYGYQITDSSHFFVVGLLDARSQFTKGYDYEIPDWRSQPTSNFFSPLYLTLAPGLEYRNGDLLNIFFSPVALRGIFASKYYTLQSDAGAFGVPYGKTFRFELGAYLSMRLKKDFSKHFSYRTRLNLYSNYLAKDIYKDGVLVRKDNPGNVDILWDNYLTFTFAKYFALNIGITALYDNDIPYKTTYLDEHGAIQAKDEPLSALGWWQIKQIMSIDFNYKF